MFPNAILSAILLLCELYHSLLYALWILNLFLYNVMLTGVWYECIICTKIINLMGVVMRLFRSMNSTLVRESLHFQETLSIYSGADIPHKEKQLSKL